MSRRVLVAEFRAVGPTLRWTKQGILMKDGERVVGWPTVDKYQRKERATIYDQTWDYTVKIKEGNGFWYEGRKA